MKMFMRTLPQNYTPAKPLPGSCTDMQSRGLPCFAKQFNQRPSGLGLNILNEIASNRFESEHNRLGKGIEIERVGKESDMNRLLREVKDIIGGE